MNKPLPGRKIRVLIVDDSALVRQTLTDILQSDPEIEVMGTATDPFAAARRIQQEVPDVITLDIEMPRMDGITFLRKIMAQRPVPVVVCSSLAELGSETLSQAWEAGAVEIIAKPRVGTAQFLQESKIRICDVVKAASRVRMSELSAQTRRTERAHGPAKKLTADAVLAAPIAGHAMARTTETVICIGASTGGTESLRIVLEALPAASPGIVIVQHMPEKFTEAFARRLNGLCEMEVKEAADGDTVLRGRVLIAPGDRHTLLQRSGARFMCRSRRDPWYRDIVPPSMCYFARRRGMRGRTRSGSS